MSYNVDDLKNLLKTKTACFDHNGRLNPVSHWGHIEFFKSINPKIAKLYSDLEVFFLIERDEIEQVFFDEDEDDSHGWHTYEYHKQNEKDYINALVIDHMYSQGWSRIGLFKRKHINWLELECHEIHENKFNQVGSELAEILNRTLLITKFKPIQRVDYMDRKFYNILSEIL